MNSRDQRDPWLEDRNSEALLVIHRAMLARVAILSSEVLMLRGVSADLLRTSGQIFGVFERGWFYPAFQLDRDGVPYPEMREILEHLSPDPRGWDRLQWFVEPNPALVGRSPVDVWQEGGRRVVLDASRREVWQGRD